MTILVTGAGGFVGGHLLTALRNKPNQALHGTILTPDQATQELNTLCGDLHVLDLRDEAAVETLFAELKPDYVYHLAGQAFVPRSFEAPWETLEINIRGTLSILQAVHKLKLNTRVLVVGSAEIYGAVPQDKLPITEATPLSPSSPYSVSKIGQDMLAYQYAVAHNVYAVRVRPFNHIGTGQNNRFAVSDWAMQIAEAEAGKREAVVYVGNLSAARDFTDVRDVVAAYLLAIEQGEKGTVYNVCSGEAHTMQDILDRLCAMSTIPIEVKVAPERFRPVEVPLLVGDASKLRTRTGWQPQISLSQTLRDVLEEWRARVFA